MCVIIITNPKHQISKEELYDAWLVNCDGAGYAYPKNGKVHFKKGFMDFKHFWDEVKHLQKKYDMMLHLRISTCAGVTSTGTHPYKTEDLLKLKGTTKKPVISMNGTIPRQTLHKKQKTLLNDTASYIKDNKGAFEVINQDILNLITENTSAKWSAATPEGIIFSETFQEHDGRHYSNLNHLFVCDSYLNYTEPNELTLKDLLEKSLYQKVVKNWELWDELENYVYENCRYYNCRNCTGCITNPKNTKQLKTFLDENIHNTTQWREEF